MEFMSRVALLVAALLFAAATSACNGMFYFPSRGLHGYPTRVFHKVELEASDGVKLRGWLFPAQGEKKGTFVQFHGNAGNVSSHFKALSWVTQCGYSFLTFDYRGYGESAGYPWPEGVRRDALAAIDYAHDLPRGSEEKDLILYGQSLGGAVLLDAYPHVRDKRRVRLLVVEGSFHSYQEVAASVLWKSWLFLPLTGLAYATISDDHAPYRSVAKVAPTPLLIIHGERDDVVPLSFGLSLYRLARPPRTLWIVPGGRHIDAMSRPEYRRALLDFVETSDG